MATSRLFLLSSSLFRAQGRTFFISSLPPSLLSSSSRPPSPRFFSISVLRPLAATPFSRLKFYTTSSAAVAVEGPVSGADEASDSAVEGDDEASAPSHPWPEWDRFLGKLRSKGYFEISSPDGGSGGITVVDESSAEFMEMNRLKNACLKFARERFDILRSLPKEDIQAVVECGCPNLFRKAVNSAKRLRAFLKLEEGDVCSACNLKGSCDKAYAIAKEDEAARTVDIMRILMSYAINPAALSAEESPVKVQIQESARKLLSELIKLSDTTLDPTLSKPSVQSPSQKDPSQKDTGKKNLLLNTEMKRGDWLCTNCNFMNFARNIRCLECKADGPKKVKVEFGSSEEMKLGDWTCPKCQFMNFSRNTKCIHCKDSVKPKLQLNPGEWECPSCKFLNFRRNTVCKKCNCDRPDNERDQLGDHTWRKPKQANRNSSFKFGDDDDDIEEDSEDNDGKDRFKENRQKTSSAERRRPYTGRRNFDYGDNDGNDDVLPFEEGRNRSVNSQKTSTAERRRSYTGRRNFDYEDKDAKDDALPVGEGRSRSFNSQKNSSERRRSFTGRRNFDYEDNDGKDDVLPFEEGRNRSFNSQKKSFERRRSFTGRRNFD